MFLVEFVMSSGYVTGIAGSGRVFWLVHRLRAMFTFILSTTFSSRPSKFRMLVFSLRN